MNIEDIVQREILLNVCNFFVSVQRSEGRSGEEIQFMLGGGTADIDPITQLNLLAIRDSFIHEIQGVLTDNAIDYIFMGGTL